MPEASRRLIRGCAISIVTSAAVVAYVELTGHQFVARPALFVGILLASWFGGVRAGLFGTLLAAFIIVSSLTSIEQSSRTNDADLETLLTFVLTGVAVNVFILWRRRSETDLIRARDQLGGLHQSAAELLEARGPEGIAQTSVGESLHALGASHGLVALYYDHAQAFSLFGVQGFDAKTLELLSAPTPRTSTPAADAFFLQRPLLISGAKELARRYPEFAEAALDLKIEAVTSVPLTVKGRRYGVVVLGFPRPLKFSKSEADLIMTFANQAAHAFDHADLVTSVSAQSHEFQVVSDASLAFSELDLESASVLRKLADVCVERLADWAVVFRIRPNGSALQPVAIRDRDPDTQGRREAAISRQRFVVGEGVTGEVAASGRPRFLPTSTIDTVREAALQTESESSQPAQSVLSVPIAARGDTLGVLTIGRDSSRRFEQTHLEMAQEVARRAGLALWAANQREQAQRELELRRSVESELRENQTRLHAALAAKDEFLGLVSHELRTPLTTIRGNADILSRRADLKEESRQQAMADIHVESERLSRIIENMLYLARLEAGKRPDLEPVLLHRVVRRAAKDFRKQTPKAEIRLGKMNDLVIVEANEAYIEQVLQNLFSNAVKYSQSDHPIEVSIREDEGSAIVSVADRGIGVRQPDSSRLFEPYYRENQDGPATSGLGIGLAVCKRLVEAQGGSIDAQARKGGGTVFSFTLPVSQEREEAVS
jgi:signal transduction histidine kinase